MPLLVGLRVFAFAPGSSCPPKQRNPQDNPGFAGVDRVHARPLEACWELGTGGTPQAYPREHRLTGLAGLKDDFKPVKRDPVVLVPVVAGSGYCTTFSCLLRRNLTRRSQLL